MTCELPEPIAGSKLLLRADKEPVTVTGVGVHVVVPVGHTYTFVVQPYLVSKTGSVSVYRWHLESLS